MEYGRPNDGAAVANKATFRNEFDVDLPGSTIRFVMRRGHDQIASGKIMEAFDGGAVSVLDVNVDIGRNSVAEIQASPRQTGDLLTR